MSQISLQSILNNASRRATASATVPQSTRPSQGTSSSDANYGIITSSMPKFEDFPAQHSIGQDELFQRVCSLLKDEKVGKVGIYGMGGVGKTTLLKKIYNEYLIYCDFDIIIWIPMPKEVDYKNLWKFLCTGEWLYRCFNLPNLAKEESKQELYDFRCKIRIADERNAIELHKFLRKKKFVMLIDNIWEYLDFLELGVPRPSEENRCKIVFTTRSEEVCRQMNPDEELKVHCLDESDSWALFKVNVRERALNSDALIQGVARRVAKECGGLPLALITVGKAMSSRYSLERWEYALSLLQSYPYELQDMEEKLFYSLKFSYDSLEDETIRECFLYCSLFPDDYFIHEENLIRYWMGEGLLGELENIKKLKNRGHEIIGVLESACLLERETGRVRMHDVIRDVALWIVSGYGKQEDKFFVHPGRGLTRTGIRERWRKAHKIFVMNLTDLPVQPSCTNLSTLIFGEEAKSSFERQRPNDREKYEVPHSSDSFLPTCVDDPIHDLFGSMPSLRVLDLSCLPIPSIVTTLVALRYLSGSSTDSFEVNVGFLLNLEVLHVTHVFGKFDNNVGHLTELRVLYLDGSFSMKNICMIGLLNELRELSLLGFELEKLPAEVGRLTKLENLVLFFSSISELPSSIGQLIELQQLDAGYSQLDTLPEEIGELSRLEMLDLQGNPVTMLPNTIGQLIELRKLNLSHSKLKTLPPEIGNLMKLEVLDLDGTLINEFPDTFSQLVELRQLHLQHTRITKLPVEVGNLKSLELLGLSCSLVGELPSTVGGLTQLRELNLNQTRITKLPVVVGSLKNLEKLDLSGTDISELPSTIGQLANLKHLILEGTKLERLPMEVYNLTKLATLDLRNPGITNLPNQQQY